MSDLPRSHLILYALAFAAVLALGARQLARSGRAAATPSRAPAAVRVEPSGSSGSVVVVDVAGAVRRPGVYRLRAGARVDDAVRRAGGPTRRADMTGVNRAAKAEDGRQVIVPERQPPAAVGAPAAPAAPASAPPGPPLNLNTATPEQLDTLDGIGPGMAQKIVTYRTAHGGFRSVDELDQVPGIGAKRLAALRERVTA